MATEIEMKLRVPDEATLETLLSDPLFTQYRLDDYEVRQMSSIYYDTPDEVLYERKWTLRLRKEGENTVAAMKTAGIPGGEVFTRNEWQCAVDKIEDAIPLLIDLGAPVELKGLLKNRPLQECCRADFVRTSACLYLPDGVRIEIAGDCGYLSAGGKKEPIIELELELLFGDASALPPFCAQIMEDYGLSLELSSKYERAMRLIRSR